MREAGGVRESTAWTRERKWIAAAAGLILVAVTVRLGLVDRVQTSPGGEAGIETIDRDSEGRSVRSQLLEPAAPSVVHPIDGQALSRSVLTLAWEPVGEALEYSVLVMNAAGDLVWEDRTGAQTTTVPPDVELAPGERFYVRVTAHLRSGLDVKSSAVAFELTSE